MTDYQIRKAWRVKLNDKRNSDRDHSVARYDHDSNVINRAMTRYNITGRVATWVRH